MLKKLFYQQVVTRSLTDMKVRLDDEFDRNFTRKGFFGKKWAATKFANPRGSLMLRSGNLRSGIQSKLDGGSIRYTSNQPYAAIHNSGGEITVTKRMRGYFMWRLKEVRKKYRSKKDGSRRKDKYNRRVSDEEQFYRAMVGKKVGSKIIIPQRQFIGNSPETEQIIQGVVKENIDAFFKHNPPLR